MYWGIERRPYPKYWENVIKTYSEFARGKGLVFNPIKTNVLDVLHERRIEHDFHELLYDGALWKTLQHSLVLLPLTAPLSMGRFDRLLIAASHYPENPTVVSSRAHGSKDFFEWYKEQDLIYSHGIDFGIYRDLYNMLPFTIAKCLDVLYSKIGIKLHGNPVLAPTRKQWKLTQEN